MSWGKSVLVAALLLAVAGNAHSAGIRITEWMYSGNGAEFIELTNVSNSPIDMTGWSYDDDSQTVGAWDLSAFGEVQPGESVVFQEDADDTNFRSAWSLPATVKVISGHTNNIGRNDELNIYDAGGDLADRLTYGDGDFPGTIRTQEVSGNPLTLAAVGANDVSQWVLSSDGDSYGSYTSLLGDVGNPGSFSLFTPVPEPASYVIALAGLAGMSWLRRRG